MQLGKLMLRWRRLALPLLGVLLHACCTLHVSSVRVVQPLAWPRRGIWRLTRPQLRRSRPALLNKCPFAMLRKPWRSLAMLRMLLPTRPRRVLPVSRWALRRRPLAAEATAARCAAARCALLTLLSASARPALTTRLRIASLLPLPAVRGPLVGIPWVGCSMRRPDLPPACITAAQLRCFALL